MEIKIIPVEAARMEIPVKTRDEQFMHIQELIEVKRKMLIEKQKKLRFLTKQNHFLEEVKNDYSKYHSYIQQQKRDQITALEMLDKYIKDLTLSGKLTKHNIEDAKQEQHHILREVKSIKKSLDLMIDDTNSIQNSLSDKL